MVGEETFILGAGLSGLSNGFAFNSELKLNYPVLKISRFREKQIKGAKVENNEDNISEMKCIIFTNKKSVEDMILRLEEFKKYFETIESFVKI